ncbi:Gfo/Idh/MocA family protein [Flavobacterium silvaticum]|uniref:Gfo/Idh/MocA family oxidoreductase n=1 Tax=Flavobacterium silvaticum TaxID=1852020 RepID=A0A972FKP8_9FLAO|nr:Gfo/Idh/MocA family oxidoreductase [Flavobacterium silvaticum]NMH27010.1 Gfo/Idh/MocA family oxidoreductase [Flavobacterium silvaticum]
MDKKATPIRWGIIGCGDVTERKSGPAYQKTDGFELKAVMRRDADKAADYARRHNIEKSGSDADALINDPEIDAVYIATPPDTHKLYALKVAQAGKPCCIEKPMAPSYADCVEITTAFENANLPLFVAYYRRSLPRFLKVREWIDEGRIGTIRNIHWHLTKTTSHTDLSGTYNWRTDPEIAAGGYFDDLASHGIDLFTFFFGNIIAVSGVSDNQQGLYEAKDTIGAAWLHESGVMGTGSWNFGAYQRQDEVTVYGSKGRITFAVFEEVPLVLVNDSGMEEVVIDHPENIQLYHVQNMRDHLLGKTGHPSTGHTATHTTWVLDKILGKI